MKRLAIVLLVLGAIAVFAGVSLAAAPTVTMADTPHISAPVSLPPDGATYVGSDTCFQCHSNQHRDWSNTIHPLMIQDAVANPSAILGDFAAGEETRMGTINGEERAYTLEDVVFTMGVKYRQRYIAATADGGYVVLPGQWNVDSATWVNATPGDWLKDCAGCHTTGFDVEAQTFSEIGVGCESCHGPASVHVETAMNLPEGVDPYGEEVYALRQTIVSSVDSAICGQCHNRGKSPDGEHGYPVGYVVGGPLDETMFVSVAPTGAEDDANFWPNGLEKKHRQQYITWSESRHALALESLTAEGEPQERCMGCHSTDYTSQDGVFEQQAVTPANAQYGITCVGCHSPHGESEVEDQLVGESYDLCVSCHTGTRGGTSAIRVGATVHHDMREMFEGRQFLGLGPNPSPHFSNETYGPVCATCHMPATAASAEYGDIPSHTFKVLLPTDAVEGQIDSCTTCHDMSHDDMTPEDLTFFVESTIEDNKARVEEIRATLDEINAAHPEWDPQAEEKPEEQQTALRIHTLVSFVEADGSWGFHNPDYADEILTEAEDLLEELLDTLGM